MSRRIGSLSFGPSDEPYDDTPRGKVSAVKSIRTRFVEFFAKERTKEAVNSGNMEIIHEINAQIARWDAALQRTEPLIEAFQHPAIVEWRQAIEEAAERDEKKIKDQVIANWKDGSVVALVNSIQLKMVAGFFGVIDDAIDEHQRADKYRASVLTQLGQESERMKESIDV